MEVLANGLHIARSWMVVSQLNSQLLIRRNAHKYRKGVKGIARILCTGLRGEGRARIHGEERGGWGSGGLVLH